jgi:hypothetical protein
LLPFTLACHWHDITPHSQAHLEATIELWGHAPWRSIAGISRTNVDGQKSNYGDCIMRDPKTYGRVGLVAACPNWKAVDGGAWWLRDTTYKEPSGNYVANGMLKWRSYRGADVCVDPDLDANKVFCKKEYDAIDYKINPCSELCDENAPHRLACQDAQLTDKERGCTGPQFHGGFNWQCHCTRLGVFRTVFVFVIGAFTHTFLWA